MKATLKVLKVVGILAGGLAFFWAANFGPDWFHRVAPDGIGSGAFFVKTVSDEPQYYVDNYGNGKEIPGGGLTIMVSFGVAFVLMLAAFGYGWYRRGVKDESVLEDLLACYDGSAWYNLGVAYGKLNQSSKEEDAYRQAINLNPEHANAWYGLGRRYARMGCRDQVMEVYRKLNGLDAVLAKEFFDKVLLPSRNYADIP